MKESIKKKFDSIDQSKIKVESTKELLGKIEKKLNSKTQENVDKAEALLDKFIAQAKAKNADIFVSSKPAPNLTPTQKKKATQVVKNKLDALMDTIANDPLLKDFNNSRRVKGGGKSDPLIDSERKARESGRRVSKKGWKNQYGASNGGRRYYEYRENRIDRKAPNYGSRPWLEDGGMVHPSNSMHEKFMVVEIMEDGSRKVHNKFPDMESAMMFGALKRNFLKKGSQLIIEDENGKQVYRSFKGGGKIDESTAMVLSQNKEIAHHTEELKEALKKNPEVEPWVIGKIERASTDMSDITHYLDGKTEYAKGGYMADGGKVRWQDVFAGDNALVIAENKMGVVIKPYGRRFHLRFPDGSEKTYSAEELEFFKDEEYAKGGSIDTRKEYFQGTMSNDSIESILNYEYPNNRFMVEHDDISGTSIYGLKSELLKAQDKLKDIYKIKTILRGENEMGMPHLSVPPQFVFFAKGGNISGYKLKDIKGRLIEEGDMVKTKQAEGGLMSASEGEVGIVEKTKDAFNNDALLIRFRKTGKNYDTTILLNGKINEIVEKGKNSTNPKTPKSENYTNRRNVKLIVIKNPNKKGTKDYLTIDKKDFLNGLNKFEEGGKLTKDYTYIKRGDVTQVAYYDEKGKTQIDFKPKNGFWVSKKALVDAGMNETKAKFDAQEVANEIIALSNKAWDTLSIESGSEIYASDSLQENLADEYYTLGIDKIYKKLTKPERKKVSDILTNENEHSLRNYLALRGFNGEAEYKNYAKMYEDTYAKFGYRSNWNPKNVDVSLGVVSGIYAKGGDIGFEKLANKVAKNYEGEKVKPKYQKEYGKTYDKAEAKEVGNKVAAKVYRQQLAKMEHGGKLPEDLGKYFIKTRSTKVIKMEDLIPLRARPTGIANAEKYMKMAYDGEMEKRKPITIYKSQRKYRVLDGNSTYAVAKANGWENIWAEVVKNPNMKNGVKRTDDIFSRAKSIRKEGESWQDALQRAKSMK